MWGWTGVDSSQLAVSPPIWAVKPFELYVQKTKTTWKKLHSKKNWHVQLGWWLVWVLTETTETHPKTHGKPNQWTFRPLQITQSVLSTTACLPVQDLKQVILIKRNFKIFSRGGLLYNGVRDANFCDCLNLQSFVLLKNASGVENIGRKRWEDERRVELSICIFVRSSCNKANFLF